MDSRRITITIDEVGNEVSKISTFCAKYKSGNRLSATPLADEEFNRRMEAGKSVLALPAKLSKSKVYPCRDSGSASHTVTDP